MSACSEEPPGSPRRYGDVRALRTQAMPAHSLFGSVLERLSSAEQRELAQMDLPRMGEVARTFDAPKIRGAPDLPLTALQRDLLQQEHGPQLAAWRHEHRRLQESLRQSDDRLQALQRHTRYDFDHPPDLLPKGEKLRQLQEEREAHRRWLSLQDLQHAPEVNRVGLKPAGAALPRGFNRDKFGTRPPAHRYALIGDVLRPGMDFAGPRPGPEQLGPISARFDPPGAETRATRTKTKTFEREEAMRKLPPKTHVIPGSELEIPANIKHHFGSHLCENVLSDPSKLPHSARPSGTSLSAAKKVPAWRRSSERRGMDPNYASLSTNLRSNVFPGSTAGHHLGTTHRRHNSEVYTHREEVPDKYRFQWDHISRWNEANVLHCRVLKALEETKAAAAK